jgi:glycosyltransferase involved in cell wall biosynthesis
VPHLHELLGVSDSKERLSVAIICLNEIRNIERCILSVPFADEIVVVDSGSSDGTIEKARGLGARVEIRPWLGFRAQKQLATDLCKNDWVLSLDADESLSIEAQAEVEKQMQSEKHEDFAGYRFPRKTYYLGRWIRHGGWYPDFQLRLFDRKRAKWGGGEHVHEHVVANSGDPSSIGKIGAAIEHRAFVNIYHQVQTNNRYSGLGADELLKNGKHFSVLKLFFKPWSKFFETYFIKRGFLDGLPGFIISVSAAYSVFLKFAKLWEIETGATRKQGGP